MKNNMIASSKKRKMKISKENILDCIFFLGPMFIVFTFVFTLPLIMGIVYSFTNWSGISGVYSFNGIENYIRMFKTDSQFIKSLWVTGKFVFWNCLLTNIFAMLFAVLLTKDKKSNVFTRTALFLPNMISLVVVGFIWRFLLKGIGQQAYELTGSSLFSVDILGNPQLVVYALVLVSFWAGVGYIMIIYIAAIKSVDKNVLEAGQIDGCNKVDLFFKVTLPSMISTVSVGIFINIAGSIKIFDMVWSLTNGGPGGASEVAMVNVYREAFERQNFGYANAKSIVLTLIIIVITAIQLKITERKD
jgi:raffinose/stachyose/melibiose transport system permease protein